MTLRAMAKILGISPSYLSLLVNGKRKWNGDSKERYNELVNSTIRAGEKIVVPRKGLEPPLPYGKRILSCPCILITNMTIDSYLSIECG